MKRDVFFNTREAFMLICRVYVQYKEEEHFFFFTNVFSESLITYQHDRKLIPLNFKFYWIH